MTELNPNDPVLLKMGTAPHEPSAILRMHNAGHKSQAILELFHLRGTELIRRMQEAQGEANVAKSIGRPIHEALIPKEAS